MIIQNSLSNENIKEMKKFYNENKHYLKYLKKHKPNNMSRIMKLDNTISYIESQYPEFLL